MGFNEHEFSSELARLSEEFRRLNGVVKIHAGAYDTAYNKVKETITQRNENMAFLTSTFFAIVTAGTAGYFGKYFGGFLLKFGKPEAVVDGCVDAKKQAITIGLTVVSSKITPTPENYEVIAPFQFLVRSLARLDFEEADALKTYREIFENTKVAVAKGITPKKVVDKQLVITIDGKKVPISAITHEAKLKPDQGKLAKAYEKFLWYNYCQSLRPRTTIRMGEIRPHYENPTTGIGGWFGDLPRECYNRILELGVSKNDIENVYMPIYNWDIGNKIPNGANRTFSFSLPQ